MENNNSSMPEKLDDDILQCRSDILRSRKKAKQALENDTDSTEKQAEVAPAQTDNEKTIRIPRYEELVESTNVVDAKWENKKSEKLQPLVIEETQTPAPKQTSDTDDTITIEQAPAVNIDQQETTDQVDTPSEDILVTPQEEEALLSFDSDDQDVQSESDIEEKLAALKQQIEQAKTQAQTEIDDLEDVEELMDTDGIEKIADEKIEEIQDTTEKKEKEDQADLSVALAENSQPAQTQDKEDEDTQQNKKLFTSVKKANGIPSFDIAEKILAQQRKVASNRRQRPQQKRDLSKIMPIAGTVGQIVDQAKKAASVKKQETEADVEKAAAPPSIEMPEPVETINIQPIEERTDRLELSVAASGIIKDAGTLDPYQQDIIADIVSNDIAMFCGELV